MGHGGLLRAFSFTHPSFWVCLGDLPPDMPRRPETSVSLETLWPFAELCYCQHLSGTQMVEIY